MRRDMDERREQETGEELNEKMKTVYSVVLSVALSPGNLTLTGKYQGFTDTK